MKIEPIVLQTQDDMEAEVERLNNADKDQNNEKTLSRIDTYSKSGLSKAASQISRVKSRIKSGRIGGIKQSDVAKLNAVNGDDVTTNPGFEEKTKDTDESQGVEKPDPSVAKTGLSKVTKASTVTQLQRDLEEEKQARVALEEQVAELQKLNSQITAKLEERDVQE